jgi:hypothetical protein
MMKPNAQFDHNLIQQIELSPFQKRKYFDEDKLKDLVAMGQTPETSGMRNGVVPD